jgi:hypothetical protein
MRAPASGSVFPSHGLHFRNRLEARASTSATRSAPALLRFVQKRKSARPAQRCRICLERTVGSDNHTLMQSPPFTLDGARVLKFADLTFTRATGQISHYLGDERVTDFAAVALAQYDDGPGVYIFYCDVDWNVITDTVYVDLADAEEQAQLEFMGLELVDAASA